MLKTKILLAFTILISSYGFAQISNVAGFNGVPLRTGSFDDIQGSPYFDGDQWKVGSITALDGKVYDNAQIRFNGYTNELEYIHIGNPIILDKGVVKTFEFNIMNLNGSVERYTFASGFKADDDVKENDFVRIIYVGENFSIIQKVYKEKIKVTPASYGESDYEKFIDNDDFYFINSKQAEKFKLNKKSFYEIFPEFKSEIQEFLKKNNLKFNNIEEVEALAQFIDRILVS